MAGFFTSQLASWSFNKKVCIACKSDVDNPHITASLCREGYEKQCFPLLNFGQEFARPEDVRTPHSS